MRALTKKEWTALGGFGAIGGLLYWFRDDVAMAGKQGFVATVKDIFGRGPKLSHGRYDSNIGVVTTPPQDLRAEAIATMKIILDDDTYALARMIRSEGAAQGEIRAHVALNDMKEFKYDQGTLYGLLTYSTDPKRRGFYGDQWSPSRPALGYVKQNARRYSTNKDPYEVDALMAIKVLADRANGIDKANGATRFIDISSMGGKQAGTVSFAQKDAEWKAEGFVAFQLPEYGMDLVLYRRG